MDFKDKVIFVRAKLDISQKMLAELLNVSWLTVQRWESGKHSPTRKAVVAFEQFCHEKNITFPPISASTKQSVSE